MEDNGIEYNAERETDEQSNKEVDQASEAEKEGKTDTPPTASEEIEKAPELEVPAEPHSSEKLQKKSRMAGKLILWVLIIVCTAIVTLQIQELVNSQTDASNDSLYNEDYKATIPNTTKITDPAERDEILGKISSALNTIRHNNGYIEVMGPDNEELGVYYYNGHSESIGQVPAGFTVFTNNGQSIAFSREIGARGFPVMDPLTTLDYGIRAASENIAEIYRGNVGSEDEAYELTSYFITVNGRDNLYTHWGYGNPEMSSAMLHEMNLALAGIPERSVVYQIAVGKEIETGINVIAASSSTSIGQKLYMSWIFDGYVELGEWRLVTEMYDPKYASFETTVPPETSDVVLDKQIVELEKAVAEFSEKYGIAATLGVATEGELASTGEVAINNE